MKFIYFSDSHFRSRRPIRRVDEAFFENQMKKLDEIVSYCIDNKYQAIVHGGDLFDVALPDYGVYNAVAKRFNTLAKAKIQCYITPGSHDLLGYRVESLDKTGIGALIHSGLLQTLIGPQDIGGVLFYGVPALLQHTAAIYKVIPPKHIVVTHNVVTADTLPFDHVTFQDLSADGSTRIYLCGHYHKFFKVQVGSAFFFSTGPLIRLEKTDAEHTPNVLSLEVDVQKLTFNTKFLACASNVLDLTEKPELGSLCISGLKETRINFFNLFELTKQIAQRHQVDPAICDEALRRLDESQRSLTDA